MHALSLTLTALLIGISSAQTNNIPGIPQCAGACIGNFGGCGALDADCICNNSDLITNLACCVSVECSEADQESALSQPMQSSLAQNLLMLTSRALATLTFANGICADYDANLPQTASCAPGAQSAPQTGSATAGGSSTTATSAGSSEATTTGSSSASEAASSAAGESAASASASETPNLGSSHGKVESGLGLGLAVAGLIAAI